MSADGNLSMVVSRQELDALLTSSRAEAAAARDAARAVGMVETGCGELAEIAKRFGLEQGRSLSTLYQTPIRFKFSHWEEITLRQFAAAMLPTDRVARINLGVGNEDAYLLLNRPLVFGWMMISFGARPSKANDLIPSRAYTRIEEHFIKRASEDIARQLAKALSGDGRPATRVLSIEDPTSLFSRSKRPHRVISLEVAGLGDSSILRVALPPALIGDAQAETSNRELPSSSAELAGQLYETPISVHFEMGSTELPLCDVARLAIGDEITVQGNTGSGLVVKVEGTPKFIGEPGKIGRRLAVRITDVIQP